MRYNYHPKEIPVCWKREQLPTASKEYDEWAAVLLLPYSSISYASQSQRSALTGNHLSRSLIASKRFAE
jgi:hypothetical protein